MMQSELPESIGRLNTPDTSHSQVNPAAAPLAIPVCQADSLVPASLAMLTNLRELPLSVERFPPPLFAQRGCITRLSVNNLANKRSEACKFLLAFQHLQAGEALDVSSRSDMDADEMPI